MGCRGIGEALADRVEQLLDALAGLRRDQDAVFRGQSEDLFDLHRDAVGVRGGKVDLVDDRNEFQIVLHREVRIGHGLSLDALSGIDHQHGAFACGQGSGDFVGEVDVPGRVDEVQLEVFAIMLPGDGHRGGLDGDAALALEFHRVEQLFLLLAGIHCTGFLHQTVGQGAFPVVDVGDDREVSDLHGVLHCFVGWWVGARTLECPMIGLLAPSRFDRSRKLLDFALGRSRATSHSSDPSASFRP